MFKSISLVMLSLIVLSLGLADMSQASVRKKRTGLKKPVVIQAHQISIRPWFTMGKLTGTSGDKADFDSSGVKRKILIGGGGSLYYHLNQEWAAGFSFSVTWKELNIDDWGPLRAFSYSLNALYDPYPLNRTAPSFRLEIGQAKTSCLNYDNGAFTADLGMHFFYSLGIELRTYTASGTKLTTTLCIRTINTDGYQNTDLSSYRVPFNVTYIGLELGVSIPLKKFPL